MFIQFPIFWRPRRRVNNRNHILILQHNLQSEYTKLHDSEIVIISVAALVQSHEETAAATEWFGLQRDHALDEEYNVAPLLHLPGHSHTVHTEGMTMIIVLITTYIIA